MDHVLRKEYILCVAYTRYGRRTVHVLILVILKSQVVSLQTAQSWAKGNFIGQWCTLNVIV